MVQGSCNLTRYGLDRRGTSLPGMCFLWALDLLSLSPPPPSLAPRPFFRFLLESVSLCFASCSLFSFDTAHAHKSGGTDVAVPTLSLRGPGQYLARRTVLQPAGRFCDRCHGWHTWVTVNKEGKRWKRSGYGKPPSSDLGSGFN